MTGLMSSRHARRAAVLCAAGVLSVLPARGAPLPGGAGSLVETYQDWVVACQAQNERTLCVMRQVQSNTQTGQHVLTVEFSGGGDGGRLGGVLLMPFGLSLAEGITAAIDNAAPGPALAFATCTPQGCLAPIAFEADQVAKLKAGTSLNLTARSFSPAQPIALKVSLKGFSAALNRIGDLMK